MDGPPPLDAVCVTCRCGKRALVEPRWFNKQQSCAGCEGQYMILMIQEGASWRPKVMFDGEEQGAGDAPKPPAADTTGPWFNVTCSCGRKIGVDRRLAGRTTRCSSCAGEILISLAPKPGGGDTTHIIRGAKPPTPAFQFPAPKDVPPPPTEMHLLCTCGEELLITRQFYNAPIRCGSCFVRLQLKLNYDASRNRYELGASVIPDVGNFTEME